MLANAKEPVTESPSQEERHPVAIDDVIEAIGFGWFQVRLVTIAGIMSFVDTMEMALGSDRVVASLTLSELPRRGYWMRLECD
jgi:hypothetical protein